MFEFMGVEHPTLPAMLDAIAREWLAGNDQRRISDSDDPEALAAECMREWNLDDRGDFDDPDQPTHMDAHGYDVPDLAAAFARLRPLRLV
jgi:hypothetical protein